MNFKPFIKTKVRDPKPTDFSKHELVINISEGSLFYKSNKGIHKLIPALTTATTNTGTTQVVNNYNYTTEETNNYSFFTANGDDIYYSSGKIGIEGIPK